MIVVAVGLVGVAAGAVLGRLAVAVESYDGLPDWRACSQAVRISVTATLMVVSGSRRSPR
ncbi:hypothetical protein GCM10029992_07920 [Glycomyces albus]